MLLHAEAVKIQGVEQGIGGPKGKYTQYYQERANGKVIDVECSLSVFLYEVIESYNQAYLENGGQEEYHLKDIDEVCKHLCWEYLGQEHVCYHSRYAKQYIGHEKTDSILF